MYYNKYPLEKYKFYTDGKKVVVAVTEFEGSHVKGVAKCSPGDTFDLDIGREIAAEKCNLKIKKMQYKANCDLSDFYTDMMNKMSDLKDKYDYFSEENLRDIQDSQERLFELTGIKEV